MIYIIINIIFNIIYSIIINYLLRFSEAGWRRWREGEGEQVSL